MYRYLISGLMFCLAFSPVQAAERSHRITSEDYFSIAAITDVALSPDGSQAVWTEMRWEVPAEHRNVDLWLMDMATHSTKRLSFDPEGVSGIRWSPDGKWIYYASSCDHGDDVPPCDGKQQIWRMSPDGGRPLALTREKEGVRQWDLGSDGQSLIYTVKGEEAEDQWKEIRGRFSDLDYPNAPTEFSKIRRLDLRSWRSEDLDFPKQVIRNLDLGKKGQYCVMMTTPDNELLYREGWSRVDLLDLSSGKDLILTPEGWRSEHPSPYGWIDDVSISDDETMVAFSISFDGYPTMLYVSEKGEDGWNLHRISVPKEPSIEGSSVSWRPASHDLLFLADDHARRRLYTFRNFRNGRGDFAILTKGDVSLESFSFDARGEKPLVVAGALDDADNLYALSEDGKLRRLSNINPQIEDWILPSIRLVQWKAADGSQVEGILETPAGWTAKDGPLPMVVEIHGGPSASTLYRMRFWIYGRTLLPSQGYALLSPNYRGSTGYGDRFMTDLIGHENEVEVGDILAGVDAMVAEGIADPDRLGVMGWSNGGFLTDALIAASTRFKAASSGAGVIDQSIQWATEDTPGHVINFMKGLPWENPEAYIKGSPLFGMASTTTPTLIHVGGSDPRVPPAHSRALYRALKIYLDVPTELVIYPGAHHGLSTYTHRKAKMEWDLAWYEKYLGKGWTPGETADDSPDSQE